MAVLATGWPLFKGHPKRPSPQTLKQRPLLDVLRIPSASANASSAAVKAKEIATFLDANGWEATLAKFKPNPIAKADVCTLGEFLAEVGVRGHYAQRTLRIYSTNQPQVYLALFLCLWAGLRRKEADCLLWEQIDFEEGTLHVRRTPYFEPKTEESQRTIDLAPAARNVLRKFKQGNTSEFVMLGGDANPSASYGYYRADCTWRELTAWLKSKGVRQRNAIHSLRKESGSLIASNYGIEAARQHLGHRDIRTTSSHYVDKKKRVEINIPMGEAVGQLRIEGDKKC